MRAVAVGRLPYFLLFSVLLLAGGCATQKADFTFTDLHSFPDPVSQAELEPIADIDVLALSPAMRELLDRHVAVYADKSARQDALQRLFKSPHLMRLKYDRVRTGTASETFSGGGGDCVSFANLVVAMARYVGLEAVYQDVVVKSSWDKQGDFAVLKRHVNVRVGGAGLYHIYDFFPLGPEFEQHATPISDAQARAQYFNNLGVAQFRAGAVEQALRHLKRAWLLDPRQGFILSNIGTLYSNSGQYAVAENFLRSALALDSNNMSAMVNLVELYWKQGRDAEVAAYERRVEPYRLQNPYYRYLLAEEAYEAGRYADALRHLQRATSLKQDYSFYMLMAKAYGKQGRAQAARDSYRRALELAPAGEASAEVKACCAPGRLAVN